MAGRHIGPGGNPVRDVLRLRESFPAAGGVFGTAPMLLRWQGEMLLLLQRRAVPLRSEQIGPRARSVAGQFADG